MKIGLIAMSAIRTANKELLELGLTLPGFVERSQVIAKLPSLGLLTLAGLTPEDVELEYVDIIDLAEWDGVDARYDAVAISSFSMQIFEAYELADQYRALGTKVLLGGIHVTLCPEEAAQHADAIVLGEGESAWPEILKDLKNNSLKSCYDVRKRPFNLANAPMPRFDLLDADRYNRFTVQTTRGCPYDCEFCAASKILSPAYRVKPVKKVIAEIRCIKELWRKPFIEFADDNTFVKRKHSRNLLRALAAENIRWFTETDISVGRDDELLALMRDSGCAQVLIGFESASRNALKGIERRSDWKAKQYDSYLSAIENIQNHGIGVNGCFVLGLDHTGTESFKEVLNFVRDSGLHEVQITIQTAFPGSPLYDRLQRSGRMIQDDAWELCTLFDVNFQPDKMTVAELEENFCWLAKELYSDQATKGRQRRFYRQLRQVIKDKHLHRRAEYESIMD